VPSQIEWEWLEYKLHFNGLLERYSALLARDAKRLKAERAEEPSQLPLALPSSRHQAKAALSTRVLSMRGVAAAQRPPAAAQLPTATEETA